MSASADAAGGKQSRRMSLIEAISNVVVGFGLAIATQMLVFPMFGLQASFVDNLALGSIFTGASIARSYVLRRLFETIRVRSSGEENLVRQRESPYFLSASF